MSRDITPFALRMPPELRAQVEEAAAAKGRLLNVEILVRLTSSFSERPITAEEATHLFNDLALEIRTIEGGLNKGFNQLAATVYGLAKRLESEYEKRLPEYHPNHPDIPISQLPDPDE